MKRAAILLGLAYLWTLVASAVFCAFKFSLFTFPYVQWWQGLYYVRSMLWMPRLRDLGHWPLLFFIDGFVLATLITLTAAQLLLGPLLPRRNRQPKLYGESRFEDTKGMAAGGIISERRR